MAEEKNANEPDKSKDDSASHPMLKTKPPELKAQAAVTEAEPTPTTALVSQAPAALSLPVSSTASSIEGYPYTLSTIAQQSVKSSSPQLEDLSVTNRACKPEEPSQNSRSAARKNAVTILTCSVLLTLAFGVCLPFILNSTNGSSAAGTIEAIIGDVPNAQKIGSIAWEQVGQYDEAIKDVTSAFHNEPTPTCKSSALWQRALYYFEDGKNDKALADFKDAHKLGRWSEGYLPRVLNLTGYYRESLVACAKPSALGNDIYYDRAYAEHRLGQFNQSSKDLKIALPQGVSREYGIVGFASSIYEEELGSDLLPPSYWSDSVHKGSLYGYLMRAIGYNRLGEYNKAIQDCDQIITHFRSQCGPIPIQEALLQRSYAYEKLNMTGQSQSDFRKAMQYTINDPVRVGHNPVRDVDLALALERAGKYHEAITYATKVIQTNPSLAVAFRVRAGSKYRLNEFKEALADLDQAIALNPTYGKAFLYKSMVETKLGNSDQAIKDKAKAKELGWNEI